MRQIVNLNKGWRFAKDFSKYPQDIPKSFEEIDLPHTWNGCDGQDGGNDYFRGTCVYCKKINRAALPQNDRYFLEICGANSSADVFVDGAKLAHHDGGYSAFRVDLTESLTGENELCIAVDNAPNEQVYPQMADFTFYGGLYRDVNLICVPNSHFDLEYYGGTGLMITPTVKGQNGSIEVQVFVKDFDAAQVLVYTVCDREGRELWRLETNKTDVTFEIADVHLWQGRRDPYLYRCEVRLMEGTTVLDTVSHCFGFRNFKIDPERGFILNGEEYPLRGVSRHQDRPNIGNALLPEHHEEDIELIMEMGANSVRLAHYQHSGYFYDLCDRKGLVVWAEIPYISRHMPKGRENTLSQLKELITQNYNHPSIAVWGLSNEISIAGADEDMLENHKILNDLAHEMDKTRPTAVAAVSMCRVDDPYLRIPDAVCYNHYFGWYGGDVSMNGPWFDRFHAAYPHIPIGISEYGCEALNWHTSKPTQGDYTEEYQAYYHERLIEQIAARKYLWATYVWNMFDFGADARSEGGENGKNHKGLVTMDRKYKKDAFYAYKAWLADREESPFVHLCGKRYVDRVEDMTVVTVYSNLPEVELFVSGVSVGKKNAQNGVFCFDVKNEGETVLVAKAGDFSDEGKIRKVETPNPDYILVEKGAVLSWFEVSAPDGYFSLLDTIGDILSSVEGKHWFGELAQRIKNKSDKGNKSPKGGGGFDVEMPFAEDGFMQMMSGFTVLRLTSMMGMMNVSFTKEELLEMNVQLNHIPKKNHKQ